MLNLERVTDWSSVWDFLRLPYQVHSPESPWVPPLRLYERLAMGRVRASGRGFWLVRDGGRPVARLGAQVDPRGGVRFGFFECLEAHPEAVPLLLEAAQDLARGQPLLGPMHFELEEPYTGVLVEGFEHQPTFLMSYNPPYYGSYLEQAGLKPAAELYSYRYLPEKLKVDRMAGRAGKAARAGVTIQETSRWQLSRTIRTCVEIANEAWSENWGYHPPDESQIRKLLGFCHAFYERAAVLTAHYQGRMVGFLWALRNLNPILKRARGRLGFRLLVDYLNRGAAPARVRGYGLGVLPDCRHLFVPAALIHHAFQELAGRNWVEFEVSWVLRSNVRMNVLARALGGEVYKKHRLYSNQPEVV